MSKFIYKFENYADYLAVKDTLEIPSISYVKDLEVVINNGLDEVSSEMPERVEQPIVSHANNIVSVYCETSGATIYYTTDGSDPTIESSIYSSPIQIYETIAFKTIAVKYGMLKSYMTAEEIPYEAPYANVITYSANMALEPGSTMAEANLVDSSWDPNTGIGTITYDRNIINLTDFYGSRPSSSLEITNVVIPETTEWIWTNCLYDSNHTRFNLDNLVIPASVSKLGANAIEANSITFEEGSNLEVIDESRAIHAPNLTILELPEGFKDLGSRSYSNNCPILCPSLTTLILPSTIEHISFHGIYNTPDSVSSNCTLTIKATDPSLISLGSGTRILDGMRRFTTIYVPAESVDAYKTAQTWSYVADIIQAIPE